MLKHVAEQPGREALHPLLTKRPQVKNTLAVVVTGDRGLAGAYNTNVIRFVTRQFDYYQHPVHFIAVGRKGRDLMIRRRKNVRADFSNLPAAPSFMDVSAIGRMVVEEFLEGRADEVYLVYTDFVNMVKQETVMKRLLPLEVDGGERVEEYESNRGPAAAYIYEPGEREILDEIIPRFTGLQIYQAVLESQASEHAARMIAMRNATDSALELVEQLKMAYNKVRQQAITNDILDIVGGANALAQS